MTDYNKLIRDDDPYSRLIQGEQAQALRGAMAGAAGTQPDVEARLRQMSQRLGVPVDSVRIDPVQAERQAAVGSIDYDRLVRQTPVTADFLTKQAQVARDDVGVLTRLERAFTAFGQGITKGSLQDELGPLHYRAMTGEITPAEQARRKQLSDQMKALDALPEKGDSPLSWFLNVTGYAGRQAVTGIREGGAGAVAGAAAGAGAAAVAGQLGPQVAVPEEIVTVPGAALFGGRTGYKTASMVFNYKMEAGFAFDEFEGLKDANGKPMPRDVAQGAAAAVGLINAGLETAADIALLRLVPGLDKLLGSKQAVKTLLQRPTFRAAIAEAGKRWMKASTIEGVTEGIQEITVILGRELAQGVAPGQFPATPIERDVERVAQATAEGAAGAAGVGAPVAGVRAGMNIREVRIAQRNQDFMVALGESAQASKLRERLPEAFREFVQKAREAGPVENVYIPADQFARYFQSQNVDPAAVAAEVGAANFAEAVAAGTDVVIPLENYAEKLAATQHHGGLMQDVKLHQGDLTMREAQALEQRQQELQAELEAMIERESGQVAAPVVEQIKQDVMGELVGRFERGTADAYATTYAKTIATLAQRAGIDPMELHRTYGLRVVTPLPAILQQQGGAIDTALDPLLDRLRAGEVPTEVQAYGPSLFEFIRDRGGLKPVGETRAMDENITRRAFQRKMSQEGGMGVDAALEAAVEAGYFPGVDPSTLGEAEMLNALAEDVGGNRVYSPQNRDENLATLREQLLAMQDYIEQLGGDIRMDNAALRELIMRAAEVQPGDDTQQFDQAFNGPEQPKMPLPEGTTEIEVDGVMRPALNSEGRPIHPTVEGVRNFWRWFGDSKVVDEQGRPLVVYHGTTKLFDVFKPGAMAGIIYASPSGVYASQYAGAREGSPNVMPLYLRSAKELDLTSLGEGELTRDEFVEFVRQQGVAEMDMPFRQSYSTDPAWAFVRSPTLVRALKASGFDGIKQIESGVVAYGVFDPTQVKSATGNYGTFDPNQQSILFQSATIRAGRETLKKYGLNPGQTYKTRQVAAALEARQRAKYGTIAADDRSPEALSKISKWMVEEVLFEMQHPEKSGVGWYSEKFQRALDVFGDVYPELKTDQNARDLLTALIAITSDGQKVVPNFAQAIDVYGNFRESGKFVTGRGHMRQDSILNNLAKIQELHDTLGPEAMRDYLMQEATVSELKRAAAERGIQFSTQYQAHIKLPMAALIFGPKLGAFYANLMGAHGYLTMDRWWSRTFNRYRGTLLSAPTKDGLVRFRALLAADKGIDTAQMSDDELLSATVEYRESYEAKNFKNGTEIEKAANTIYKDAFEGLEDQPFNAKDRTFMLDAVDKARQSLKRRGVDMSIADIQAVLWYYEKRLYGELGARQTADISYEEAARKVAAAVADGGGDRAERLAALSDGEGAGQRDAENVPPGEEDFVEGDGDVTLYQSAKRVDTPEFRGWFGNSAVVDEQGRPLVVYHSTDNEFSVFERGDIGFHFGNRAQARDRGGRRMIKAYLSIQNPLRMADMGEDWDRPLRMMDELISMDVLTEDDLARVEAAGQGLNAGRAADVQVPMIVEMLKRAGYDGIVYENEHEGDGGYGDGQDSWIAFDATQIKATSNRGEFDPQNPNMFAQADDGDKRGFIQFGADRKFTIGLLEKADLSTFLHESGHFWLEVLGDLAERQDAADQIKADYQTLLDWFGVKSRAEITVEHHEKFARANEAYLMEGKAPSAELRGIFQRFRAWLSMIYRTLDRLNVKLNDDVRGVLDRIYATDEEIEAAKRQLDAVPLFTSAAEAGMTEVEFDAYRKSAEAASEAAKEKLQGELMREYQRAREKWWKEQRAATRLEVEAEVDATPVYVAFKALVDGKLQDGTPIKLSKDDLVRRYGEEYLKRLPRGLQRIYAREGGTSVDVAAEALGFDSGTALVEALVNMRPRKDLIEAETDARMAREYGDMMLDGTIAEEAMRAIHNEQRAKVIEAELRALRRQQAATRPVLTALARAEAQARQTALDIPPASVFRAAAAGRIGQMKAKDINPYQYLLAERRASRAAYEAAAKKDYVTAAAEKQRELMNHYLYLEATKAKQEIDKVYAYMGRFEKAATREKLGKAGADYLDQIDAILERYEFKRVSLAALAKRQSLLQFVEQIESQGLLVNIPDALLDEARRVNYREATVDELRAVRDTVKNIEHLATLKNKLLRKQEAIEFEAVKAELIESARDNFKPTGELGRPNRKGETVRDRGARLWKWFDAKHLKVEQLVEWLDGGKIDGPWARYLFDLAADAQSKEYELHAMVTAKLQELSEAMPKAWRESLADKTNITLPGVDGPVTRYTLLSLALNTGNASNLQRLRDGYGWDDATIASALGELNADDAKFVQGVWDTVNSLWPEIVALEKRVTGIAPEKVEAQPVTIGGVEVAGGYFPLVYDSRMSAVGEKQAEATESVGQFLANAYGRARTDKGYTKQRVETLKAPVLLDFEQVLTSHLTRVIKDVSHREAIYSLNKVLKDGEIKAALIDTVGEEQYRELNKWVQVLVADRADTLHQATGAAKLIMQFRTNMAIVTMGWRISTMMAQFAGFGPSADLVKPRYLAQALVDFNRYGPWSSHRETLTNMVYEKSGEMKFRADTIERDVRDSLRRMQGDTSPLTAIRKTAFYLTAMADRQVTIPTWIGAYRQALAEGQTEEAAVRAGDRAVRLSQGAGGTKDLAAVQRDNELMRLLTMYYSPFSVLYARLRDLGHTTRRVEDMPRAVARVLALVILPAVLGDLLAAKGPGDDEDKVWWAIRKALLYPVASIPVVRDLSGYLEARLIAIAGDGEMKFAPSFSLSPVVGAMDKLARLVFLRIPEAAQGARQWDDVAWDTLEASGYVLGLPTAQVRITGEYITDVLTNQAHPETPQQALHDLLFRRQEPR